MYSAHGKHETGGREMRVLFLDFDGVLHRAGNGIEEVGPTFVWLPLLVSALSSHADVVIAVHSTWRYQYTVAELRGLLLGLEQHVIAAAPRGPRKESIPWFLQMHPEVETHLILDDDLRKFGELPPPELVLCDPNLGLTTPGVIEALHKWLANPPVSRDGLETT